MEECKYCNQELKKAKYLLMNNKIYKSCPGCSKIAGEDVFYLCPDEFGMTIKRITDNNPLGLQSHCVKCRAGHTGPHSDAILCSDIEKYNGYIIPEIRFLPMSTDIFKSYDEVKKFILFELPNRGGIYYYITSKMKCIENSLVLFQYCGRLIGYAIYESSAKLAEPISVNNKEYTGFYKFRCDSLRLLNKPITSKEFLEIDSSFTGFNQVYQIKKVGLLPKLFENINGNGVTAPQESFTYIPEELDEQTEKGLKEGQKTRIVVNAYERNAKARERCLSYYRGLNGGQIKCEICGFDFGKVYGKEFEGKIHIHHLKEISSIGEEYEINPETDLIPICPNCHMVVHSRKPAITPDEMKDIIKIKDNIDCKYT